MLNRPSTLLLIYSPNLTYINYAHTLRIQVPVQKRTQRASKQSAMEVLTEKSAKKAALKKEEVDLRKQELDFPKKMFEVKEQERKKSLSGVRGGRKERSNFSSEEADQLKLVSSFNNTF